MTQDWDIKSRSSACTACSTGFEDGQIYCSALLIGNAGYERGDFCVACWKANEQDLTPYSSWQGHYRKPPEGPQEPLKKETAESLLRKLMEAEDPQHEGVIYILAVMLERKKTLVEKDVTVDDIGTVHRVYEHRQTGETFLILDPQLKLDKLEAVQTQVVELLGAPSADNRTEDDSAGEDAKTSDEGPPPETCSETIAPSLEDDADHENHRDS